MNLYKYGFVTNLNFVVEVVLVLIVVIVITISIVFARRNVGNIVSKSCYY